MVLMHEKHPIAYFSDMGAALDVLDVVEALDDGFWLWPVVAEPDVSVDGNSVEFESKDGLSGSSVPVRGECRGSGTAAPVALSLTGTKSH